MNDSLALGSKSRSLVKFDDQLGKVPPQDIAIEEAVLGAVLIESNIIHEIIHDLFADIFYKNSHSKICQAIIDLYNDASEIDLLTVTDYLRKKEQLEFCGGAYYITELTTKVNSAAHIQAHIIILKEHWLRRSIINTSQINLQKAYENKNDVFEDLDNAMSEMMGLSEQLIGVDDPEIKTATHEAVKKLEKAKKEKTTIGINTGFVDVDRASGGWVKGDLIILAARPGMGKTALMLGFTKYAAYTKNVLMFSLEMTKEQLINRLQSAESRVSYEKFRRPKDLTNEEIERITEASVLISDLNLSVYQKGYISIQEIRSRAIMAKRKKGVDLIIIDYLQLMEMPKAPNKNNSIEIITMRLKALAKELDVPIIILSQLNRAVESRGGSKRPQLSDLRDSGSIEQDADSVMFIYRPEYYDIQPTDQNGQPMQEGTTEIIWAKNRHGPTGRVYLIFEGEYIAFYDYSNIDTGEVIKPEF